MVDGNITTLWCRLRLSTIIELFHEMVFNFRQSVSHVFVERNLSEFFLLLVFWEVFDVNFWSWIVIILLRISKETRELNFLSLLRGQCAFDRIFLKLNSFLLVFLHLRWLNLLDWVREHAVVYHHGSSENWV